MSSFLLVVALAAPNVHDYQPVGKWTVEFAERRCLATRRFQASGAPELTLIFEPRPATDDLAYLYLLVPPQDAAKFRKATLSIAGSAEAGRQLYPVDRSIGGRSLYQTWLKKEDLAALPNGSAQVKGRDISLNVPLEGYGKVREVLSTCLDDLIVSWGFPADTLKRLASLPQANVAAMVKDADYPSEAIAAEASGEVEARVMVDVDGKASQCAIVRSSGNPHLDAATCAIPTRRGRFKPAFDKEGKPMAAPFLYRIRWQMPL